MGWNGKRRRSSGRSSRRFSDRFFSETTFVSAVRDGDCVVLTFSGPVGVGAGVNVLLTIDDCASVNTADAITVNFDTLRVCPLSCEFYDGPNGGSVDGIIFGSDNRRVIVPAFSF